MDIPCRNCSRSVKAEKTFHKGFLLSDEQNHPQNIYCHFCSMKCLNTWQNHQKLYTPALSKNNQIRMDNGGPGCY
jgi:hypothetical protein